VAKTNAQSEQIISNPRIHAAPRITIASRGETASIPAEDSPGRTTESVFRFENRQRGAGTRRVREIGR
jgi:hypothetical protein